METWRLVLFFLFRLALSAGILWLVHWKIGMVSTILAIPAAGVLMAKPIILAGENWLEWAKRQPFEKWNGNYYEFAGVHIRIYPVGKKLWFVDADVLKVLGEKPTLMLESTYDPHEYGQIEEAGMHGFSEEGMEKLLQASRHHEAQRMLLWVRREVVKQHRRKLELAGRA